MEKGVDSRSGSAGRDGGPEGKCGAGIFREHPISKRPWLEQRRGLGEKQGLEQSGGPLG